MENENKVFVVTAFGGLIDTICEVFPTHEKAKDFIRAIWKSYGIKDDAVEVIADDIWKTEDPNNQKIEWEIHQKTVKE